LILGDMFELGDESPAEHAGVIKKALDTEVDERIFIGTSFESQESRVRGQEAAKKMVFYETAEDAIAALTAHPITNSTILIKGSRGMALERLAGLF
jgi:UDP-N-acetylmuramoyl-tripeptide--D-alanyl-D-alanine ligase